MLLLLLALSPAIASECVFLGTTSNYPGQGEGDNGPFRLVWDDGEVTGGVWSEEVPTDGPIYDAFIVGGDVELGGAVALSFYQPTWYHDTFVFTGALSADGTRLEGTLDGWPFDVDGATTCVDGLVARWPLDGAGPIVPGWPDGAPDGFRGVGPGADRLDPASISDGACDAGMAFTGGDRVTVPNADSLEPEHVTVEAWVRSSGPGYDAYVVAKGAESCWASSYAIYSGPGYGLQFYIFDGSQYISSPDAGTDLWDGEWHAVVGSYDGAAVRLYVDGVEVGEGTPVETSIAYGLSTDDDLLIGAYRGCTLPWEGDIDEVRIWERALTADEVAENAGSCL